ncbi:helix-turn-helix domain-containing protein [Ramlibacter sp. USB13]|uniref:Helix-turn-helix domain-containing protein n=1 Tax=Ramlibacter cellulosilyticus TaxID=2764187 RepID=A0A923SC95_9BURK|nr:helix-turn-helix domain-containing protein [Ramlibacter cellulosilyticus]MBC5784659.1 helix-turn-helix domain-containing protein [Ramlibacter cellulosilyticus]
MDIELQEGAAQAIAWDLIRLLHQGAPAEEFAARLAEVEALPEQERAKPGLVELVRMAMALRNRLDLSQQRESGMLAVIESARDLSSRLHLQELLRAIVTRARNMLGSQVAWISSFDESLGAFHVMATDGALARSTGNMTAARDLGIVSVVVRTRLPFTTADYLSDTRFAHDAALDQTFRDEGIAAVVGVPLLWEDEVIGLLFVADRYHRTHTAQNISILSTLATHAAVAIKNAMAFEQAGAALASAEAARAELEHHARKVQAAAEAHEEMTSLLARGASLATLCEAVARLMEGDVLVLDEAAQVIARATAPGGGGRAAQHYEANGNHSSALAAALRQSRQVGRSVVAYEAHGEACRVSAVIAGDDVLGAVLLFRRGTLDQMSVRTFERATSVVGIVLLARERMEASQSRDQSALLRALVSPRQDDLAVLCERAGRFGLELAQPCSFLLLDLGDPHAGQAVRRLRAARLLPGTVFDEMDGVLTVLCATSQADEVRKLATELARAETGSDYRGVLSRPLAGPASLPAAYVTLRRALPVLRRIGVNGHVVNQNEMALYSTLFETHDQTSLAAFLEATIGALTGHDARRGSELAPTLLSYFDCNQNAKLAAQRLGIHVNTVRQRLDTIEDLIGHLGNATRALEIHMALRLWNLTRPS